MPEGIEKEISIDQMADLLTFLRSTTPQPKRKDSPGNVPQVLQPNPDGSVRRLADGAEVLGTAGLARKRN